MTDGFKVSVQGCSKRSRMLSVRLELECGGCEVTS